MTQPRSADEVVRYSRDGSVGVIVMDRPPVNVYDGALHVQLQHTWALAARDPDTTVVVMMAEGPHFCGGANLRDPQPAPDGVYELPEWEELRLIRSIPKPTIVAVQGGCVGGGQRIAWPCDLIFCTDDAFFSDPTASMGIGGIQSHVHTWLYGPRLAKEMIFSGGRLPASRLYQMGQVNRIYPDVTTLHRETLAFAHEISAQDPLALRQAKRAVNTTMDIMGQHYVWSRMEELLDDAPRFSAPSQDA